MSTSDPHNLTRFVEAQQRAYDTALAELLDGRKRSHWMWFIFPQLAGLGSSSTASFYAIADLVEARAYLAHPLLGPRLLECAEALLALEGRSAREILGFPDDLKLRSSATLFARISPAGSVFERLIARYFAGDEDQRTLDLLGLAGDG